MTDEEKQAEAIRLEKEKSSKQSKMLSQLFAENVFSKAGFKEEDYKEIIPSILKDDPEETKSLAGVICNTMLKQKADIEKAITDKIVKGTKTPPAGNDTGSGTESDVEKYKKLYAEAQKVGDYGKMAYYTRLVQEAQKSNEE